MVGRLLAAWLLLAGLFLLPTLAAAEDQKPPASASAPAPEGAPLPAADVATPHTITLAGRELAYTTTAGALTLANEKGERQAEVFFVAYTLNGADPATRPITFAFNGGPGAGSAYLQVGALGPRILDFGAGREPPFTSGKVIDNPDTWLDATDLVFIDPVGTGYSRPLVGNDEAQKQFWGVRQDLAALGTIVRRALLHFDRLQSPVYLAGESYGGFRAARLPKLLAENESIVVRGAVLISPVLEFPLIANGDHLSLLPWALRLPSYAAVALEAQGKLSPEALEDAERFALGDYLTALASPPQGAAAEQFYARVAGFIGLPAPLVARWHGRVPLGVFVKEIRHGDGDIVSRYDGSVAAPDPYPSTATPQSGDPILSGIEAPLTSGFVGYLRAELNYRTDRRYVLLNEGLGNHWDWRGRGGGPTSSVGASDDLREALALDPRLRFLIAHGMTDLQTPYFTDRYAIEHLPAEVVQGRVTLKLYPGGHMMYLRPASRAALHADARAIYAGAE
ncbi:MAG TPA: peptidase S10 [Stellaceae bacterium]|nr:peptidase S10 [Stellaceae bacterium]